MWCFLAYTHSPVEIRPKDNGGDFCYLCVELASLLLAAVLLCLALPTRTAGEVEMEVPAGMEWETGQLPGK